MKFVRRQQLDAFEIVAHLDTGGMAEVYLARHRGDSSLTVVKLLREQLKAEAELLVMFEEEARLMARFSHPNIVTVIGHGETDELPYIIMEYLDGDHLGVLSKVARKRGWPLTPTLFARIFLQVANALAYVHEALDDSGQPLGLVHRDVSPQNIFFCYDGRVKLLDFGIALSANRKVVTGTGMLKGKIPYMSPEQVNARPLDKRSDIFSLGIVMWEFVTGRKLFKDQAEFLTMKRICEAEILSPQVDQPGFPDELTAVILRCLQRPVEERFQHAAEVRQALSDFLFLGESQSRPDELPWVAASLLSHRKEIKHHFIDSVYRASDLQEFLFGDLGDGLDDSSPQAQEEQPGQAPRPVTSPVPSDTSDDLDAIPTVEATPHKRSFPVLPVVVFLLFAGLAVGTTWLLVLAFGSSDDPPTPPANEEAAATGEPTPGPDEPVVEEDAGIDAGTDTGIDAGADEHDGAFVPAQSDPEPEPEPPGEENLGWLHFRTKPQTDVFIRGEFVGQTPIDDMKLAPGVYVLKLRNKDEGINKTFRVRIRKGEVTSHEVFY